MEQGGTCIVIPFYNHAGSIAAVVHALRSLQLRCYLVNDGSDPSCDATLATIAAAESGWLRVLAYQPNQGKGMAVMTGLQAAAADGYSHAVQIDADGQHRVEDIRTLLQLSRQYPHAMITGHAVYDESVPKSRLYGRYLTHIWVWINTLSLQIRDSMCGLRVYPLAETVALLQRIRIGKRMSFDIEILVRLFWSGVRIVSVPVPVHYPLDGVSHFRVGRDNWEISAAHARLFLGLLWRWPLLLWRRAGFRRDGQAR
jgi:glycosyltransferase involved in cell wall biosynthesis